MVRRLWLNSAARLGALSLGAVLLGSTLVGCASFGLPYFGPDHSRETSQPAAPPPSADAPAGSPGLRPSPTTDPNQPATLTISATAPIGNAEDSTTCPANVTLSFVPIGGNATSPQGHAAMWARCTDKAFSAIDAAGTFDGHAFDLHEGSATYSGTLDGSTATITGGPKSVTFIFPVGP